MKRQLVSRTRNGGTLSEAGYWGFLRSGLRRMFRFWKPAMNAALAARVSWPGPRGRKWGFRCAECGQLFMRKDVNVDHKVPVGALTSPEHIAGFIARLSVERADDYQVLCKRVCHAAKTAAERAEK